MNKLRRKQVEDVNDTLAKLLEQLEALRDEEQEAYDNLPESLQDTERGDRMHDAIDFMESAIDSITEAMEYINEAAEQ